MAVPSGWVKQNCLLWPKLTNAKTEMLRVNGQDYDGPTKRIPVIVHKRFKDLRQAEESAESLAKREVSDVDGKKKRLKPAKKPKPVASKDYNLLVEECTRKKQISSQMNEITVSTTRNPVLHELNQQSARFENGSACTEKIENDSTAAAPGVSYAGTSVSPTTRSMSDQNGTRTNQTLVDNLPSEQVQVASFAHQSTVPAHTRADQNDVNFQQSTSDMTSMQSIAAIGQEAYVESPSIYLPGSSKQLKGILNEFSQMDTELQNDEDHLYAAPNDVSNLQIVGTMSYDQMKADLKTFIESTVEKAIEKSFSRHAAESEVRKRHDIEEPDLDDTVEKHKLIDNEDQLGAWNIKLNSQSLCHRYLEYFSKIIIPNSYNGKGDNACYTVVDCLFTRAFWTKLTWTGVNRGDKAKKGFREYGNVTQLICRIVQIGDPSYKAKNFEEFCKNKLFRYSKSRSISQQMRKSACRPNRARKAATSQPHEAVDDVKVDRQTADSHDSDESMDVSHNDEEPAIDYSENENDESDIDSNDRDSDGSL
ncbi:hypothetical protein RP20_CCG008880 [Aedes albopictus]|nr:hypothetical protein RP20_CCG008880 [Aedes albopictus]